MGLKIKQHRLLIKRVEPGITHFIGVRSAPIRMRPLPPQSRVPWNLAARPENPIGSFARYILKSPLVVNFPEIPILKRPCLASPCPVSMDWLVQVAVEFSVPVQDWRRIIDLPKPLYQNPPIIL